MGTPMVGMPQKEIWKRLNLAAKAKDFREFIEAINPIDEAAFTLAKSYSLSSDRYSNFRWLMGVVLNAAWESGRKADIPAYFPWVAGVISERLQGEGDPLPDMSVMTAPPTE